MKIMIIGAGGVVSHFLPQLLMMLNLEEDDIMICDGDKIEEHNLDRQIFDRNQIGLNKAQALKRLYDKRIIAWEEFFKPNNGTSHIAAFNPDVIFVAVDNHFTRKIVLECIDELGTGITVIFGANEYFDAQAYVYKYVWYNTLADPRVRYPEILTDNQINPLSCQGEATESTPQLAIANAMCGCMMMHLWWLHVIKDKEFNNEARKEIPHEIRRNLSSYSTTNWNQSNS
tara:strand:+ start:321 stop:1007 length:687 start_codon:yes stop_codon:yes gene_type:complete